MEGKCISSLLIVALLYALSFQSAEGCRDFICRMAKKTARECGSSDTRPNPPALVQGETRYGNHPEYGFTETTHVVPCTFNRRLKYPKWENTRDNLIFSLDGSSSNYDLSLPLRDYAWRLPEPDVNLVVSKPQYRYRLGGCSSGEKLEGSDVFDIHSRGRYLRPCIPIQENPSSYSSWQSINGNTANYKRRRQLVCKCHSRS